jgi:AcrR family transcriptional regulator
MRESKPKQRGPTASIEVTADERQKAIRAFNKDRIMEAALRIFAESGLNGASIRAIAKACGYTPGAIYPYFESKEHLYAEILTGSLGRIDAILLEVKASTSDPQDKLETVVLAVYDYYTSHIEEFRLSYYLFDNNDKKGLNKALNTDLNNRVDQLLGHFRSAIQSAVKIDEGEARSEALAVYGHLSGILLLQSIGRFKVLNVDGRDLISRYVLALLSRKVSTN